MRDWLQRARVFLGTQDFAALSESAADPVACGAGGLSNLGNLGPSEALVRVRNCFEALGAGT